MKKCNWVILGAGTIAREMADALNAVNGEIYGTFNRNPEKSVAFAERHNIGKVFETYEDVLADPQADVIYIATPHNTHYSYMKEAVSRGKHVLCEKAITINSRQMEDVMRIAEEKDVVVGEAMTIFHMPLYKKLAEIVASGAIGEVKLVQVNFGSCKDYDVTNRFFSPELAGGALLDIGTYALSFARYFLKSNPWEIKTTVNFFETGVDEQSGILLKNDEGQIVVIALTMRAKQPKRGVIAGERGYIEIGNYPRAQKAVITYTDDGREEIIEAGCAADALQYEVIDFQDAIKKRDGGARLDLSKDVMALMTGIREAWGLTYPFE